MTSAEYNSIREMIESRFRQDMAALERVWFTINGANPPDSPVALARVKREEDTVDDSPPTNGDHGAGLRSASDLGVQSAARIGMMHQGPRKKYTLSAEAKAKKTAYMKAYWAKRRAKDK